VVLSQALDQLTCLPKLLKKKNFTKSLLKRIGDSMFARLKKKKDNNKRKEMNRIRKKKGCKK
jgi:hypothetical protein